MFACKLGILAKVLALPLVILALGPTASAAELPAGFTLGKAIPDDVWMYVHGVHNEEIAWLDDEIGEVFTAFKQSGIVEEIMGMIFSAASPEDRQQAEGMINAAKELLKGVNWKDLFGGEFVFSERLGVPWTGINAPMPEYIILTRGAKGSGEANAAGLVAILEYLASLSNGSLIVKSETINDLHLWSMVVEENAIGLNMIRRGDVIGFIFGPQMTKDVTDLITGQADAKKPIVHTPRFKEALAQVKPPEDSISYFDCRMLFSSIRKMVDFLMAEAEAEGEDPGAWKKTIDNIFKTVDVFDYAIMTVETDGVRQFTHGVTHFQKEKLDSPLTKAIIERKPFDNFAKYVPAEAGSFSVDGFIDIPLLYDTVIDFIQSSIPNGDQHILSYKQWLEGVGFDPHRDVFSWWSGEMISVSMPPAVATPMGGPDSVLMIRVKDGQLASQKIDAGLNWITNALLGAGQQGLIMMPAGTVEAPGFKEVTHLMVMMMMIKPVIGVTDEWLVIGSSSAAVNTCLSVAAGKAPAVLENERFKQEGLIPKGPVNSVSFTDLSNLGGEMAQVVNMISMVGGIVTAAIPPNDPEAQEIKPVLMKAFSILSKLGPVFMKLDFFSSEASMCTHSKGVIHSESVITYKKPAPPEKKTAGSATDTVTK
ncbi:MAG: hypothetical protein JSV78_05840 [Phycisphaerales bacterium]|nr:MAG: hypothetical protein JSV78_05840 [Phycisphaerales bacterium]